MTDKRGRRGRFGKKRGDGRGKWPFRSQYVNFETDALSSYLNPRSSTHNQMKAELELFPAVSIAPVFFCRGPKL